MKWSVYIFDKEYQVEAPNSYKARILGAQLFKEESESDKCTTYFLPACRVKRHEDRRFKYDF